jgi:hypothetical protein
LSARALTSFSLRVKLREVDTKRKGSDGANKEDGQILIAAHVSRETSDKFKAFAASQERSVSAQLRVLIHKAMEETA